MANIPFLNNAFFAAKVGIGTESPGVKLDVAGSSAGDAVSIRAYNSVANFGNSLLIAQSDNANTFIHAGVKIQSSGSPFYIYQSGGSAANVLRFNYNSLADTGGQMVLTSTGNVGIGTTSPTQKLQVEGNAWIKGIYYDTSGDAGSSGSVLTSTATGTSWVSAGTPGAGVFLPLAGGTMTGLPILGNVGSDQKIQFQRTGGNVYSIEHDASQLYFYNRTTAESPLLIQNDGDVLMNAGNVGIGTTNPSQKLHVNGGAMFITDGTYGGFLGKGSSLITTASASDLGIRSENNMVFSTGGSAEKMRINANGNVGIGTTAPQFKLGLSDAAALTAVYQHFTNGTTGVASGDGTVMGIDADGDFLINNQESKEIKLYTSDSQRVTIQAGGNVGIGTTSPGAKLQVGSRGTAGALTPPATDGILFDFHNDGNPYTRHAAIISQSADASESVIDFWTKVASGTSAKKMTIRGNGNVGIGTTSPDNILHVRNGDTGYASQVGADTMLILETTNVSNSLQFSSTTSGNQFIMFGDDDPNAGWIAYAHSDNNLNFRTAGAERMRILANGNVGIGLVDPSCKLDVFTTATAANVIRARNSTQQIALGVNNGSQGAFLFVDTNHALRFGTNAAERARITADGNFGIGTDTPLSQLHVVGTTRLTGGSFGVSTDASVSSSFSYSFRDAVGINNPNSVSAPSVVGYVMTVGRSTSSGVGGGIYVEGESRFVRGLAGAIKFNAYGAGTLVSDASGNITTYSGTTPPSGVGAAGRLTIWDSGTELGNSAQLNWDFSNNRLGIGTTSPGYKLHVNGNAYINTTLYVNGQATFDDQVNVTSGYSINFGTSRLHSTSTSYLLGGNVGIGVVNPETSRLLVRGSTNDSSSNIFQAANLGGASKYVIRADGDNKWYKGDNSLSMILTSTGRVGIGTTSPATNFVVSDGGGTGLEITPQDADTKISIVAYDRIDFAYRELNFDGYNYSFRTSGNVKAVMLNNGNVGIGTTSPAAKLNVVGATGLPATSGTAFTGTMRLGVSGYGTVMDFGAVGPSTGTQWIQVTDASNQALHYPLLLQPNGGTVGIGTTSPQTRLALGSSQGGGIDFLYDATNNYKHQIKNYWNSSADSRMDFNIGRTSGVTPATIMSVGYNSNVGIGTTSPAKKLHVKESTTATYAAYIENSIAGGDYLAMIGDAGDPVFEFDSGGTGGEAQMKMYSDNVLKNLLNANGSSYFNGGNVGIGTTSPARKLDVDSAATSDIARFGNTSGNFTFGQTTALTSLDLAASNAYRIRQGSTTPFYIKSDGNVGIGTTTPGSKLEVKTSGANSTLELDNSDTQYSVIQFNALGAAKGFAGYNSGFMLFGGEGGVTTRLQSGGSYAATILTNGDFGIGTTTPDQKLHVAGTVKWEGVGTSGLLSGGETYVSVSQSANSYDLRLGYDNGDFTIKGDGKIGIGLTNPSSKLTVSSPLSTNGVSVDFQIDGGSGFGMRNLQVEIPDFGNGIRVISPTSASSDNTAMSFYQTTSQVGTISMTASATSFNTTSDYRLKENKEDISDAIERVKKLKPVKFNWIKEPNELKVDGFYAHELADIVPEAVTGKKDALDHDGNPAYQAIDQSKIVPLLAAALQQAIDKIEQLEIRIQTIENN